MKMEERKNFMLPENVDSLQKREAYAVSLRKQKKDAIIQAKRRKMMEVLNQQKE